MEDLKTITVNRSLRFRQYEAAHPGLPGIHGAMAFPAALMKTAWSPNTFATEAERRIHGEAWDCLCSHSDDREHAQLKNAFCESRRVNAEIDLQGDEQEGSIIVRVRFFPRNPKLPPRWLASTFTGCRSTPRIVRWVTAD